MFPLKDSEPNTRFPFVTWIILAINVLVFLYQLMVPNTDQFIYDNGLVPALINWSDPRTLWPFVSSIFMHGGFMHIISNMWYLAVFGDNIESKLGHFWYLVFYLLGGFVASYAQYIVSPDSTIPMIGASGAIAAVLGAYFIIFPHAQVKTLVIFYTIEVVNVSAKVLLGFWGISQLFNSIGSITSLESGGVAWFAHLGGFVFGIIVGFFVLNIVNDAKDQYFDKTIGSGFVEGRWERIR